MCVRFCFPRIQDQELCVWIPSHPQRVACCMHRYVAPPPDAHHPIPASFSFLPSILVYTSVFPCPVRRQTVGRHTQTGNRGGQLSVVARVERKVAYYKYTLILTESKDSFCVCEKIFFTLFFFEWTHTRVCTEELSTQLWRLDQTSCCKKWISGTNSIVSPTK